MTRFPLKARLLAAGAMALALAACTDDKVPVTAPEPAPLAVLDAAATLPYAPPAPVRRYEPEQGYRWAERAYGVQRAVYETPPDYRFAYGEDEPLAWETADDWSVYAEPWDAGHRYYYYEPGGDYPYFVRDDDYGYGYNRGGVLVVVVDSRGRYLPAEDFRRVAPVAGRYYARGRDLRRAGLNARRSQMDDRAWAVQAPRVSRSADRWLAAAREDNDWRRWREADRGRELDRFTAEQLRRAEAQRVRVAQQARPDERRDLAARRGEQARQADLRGQAQRAEAERRQQAEQKGSRARDDENRRQEPAQAERRSRDRPAEQAQARQLQARAEQQQRDAQKAKPAPPAQQAVAERGRRDQPAQAARERQGQAAQAERQRRDADKAQQVQAQQVQAQQVQAQQVQAQQVQAQQVQARAAQQARAADQAARAAAARERAGPKPEKAAAPARAKAAAKPPSKGEDRRGARDGDKKD